MTAHIVDVAHAVTAERLRQAGAVSAGRRLRADGPGRRPHVLWRLPRWRPAPLPKVGPVRAP